MRGMYRIRCVRTLHIKLGGPNPTKWHKPQDLFRKPQTILMRLSYRLLPATRAAFAPAHKTVARALSSSAVKEAFVPSSIENKSDGNGSHVIKNAYDIGKLLSQSGLTYKQVDAIMETIEFLRNESIGNQEAYVTKLSHKASLSEMDLEGMKRVSNLKHELSTFNHELYREFRTEQTKHDAMLASDIALIKGDLALLEVRRNSSRELLEKNMESNLQQLQSDLSRLENRVMRFSVGLLGTTCLVACAVVRLFI